jgi:hypothetical protein
MGRTAPQMQSKSNAKCSSAQVHKEYSFVFFLASAEQKIIIVQSDRVNSIIFYSHNGIVDISGTSPYSTVYKFTPLLIHDTNDTKACTQKLQST